MSTSLAGKKTPWIPSRLHDFLLTSHFIPETHKIEQDIRKQSLSSFSQIKMHFLKAEPRPFPWSYTQLCKWQKLMFSAWFLTMQCFFGRRPLKDAFWAVNVKERKAVCGYVWEKCNYVINYSDMWIVMVESEYPTINWNVPQCPHGVAVGTGIHLKRTVNIRRHVSSTEHNPL